MAVIKTDDGCEICGVNYPDDFEPYGIEEPCYNCGSYGHATEYCKQDTIHTCNLGHKCNARICDCRIT